GIRDGHVTGVQTCALPILYDPTTGTWSVTGSLSTARYVHTATLVPNGKVLVAGGHDPLSGSSFASAELYDPATGTWSATDSLSRSEGRRVGKEVVVRGCAE